jgi:Tfp pilus assembly pilus retraction ATPase PilT
MQTMNMALDQLAKAGTISEELALEFSSVRSELRQMLRRTGDDTVVPYSTV